MGVRPMQDLGYRSIQLAVTNDTRGNLTLQDVALDSGPYCAWITGETPSQGDPFQQYSDVQWGAATNSIDAAVSGQIQLSGLASGPIAIVFMNDQNGVSSCSVAPNDLIKANVAQQDTGEINHSLFSVQLIPG